MDLDDLRNALDEAGRTPVDVPTAREHVGGRAARRRRRARGLASGIALLCVLGIVLAAVAVFGGGNTHRSIDIAPPGVTEYQDLASRFEAALTYDDAHGKVVLFGGADAELVHDYAETWIWDGNGWSQSHPATSPAAREGAVTGYDPTTHDVVLFGGAQRRAGAPTVALSDTWTWDGTTWTERHPQHVPPWSSGLAMRYDPRSRSTLLLALPSEHPNIQLTPDSVSVHGEVAFGTWRWDGSDWHELSTPSAPLFATADMAFQTHPRLTPLPNGAGLLFYSSAVFTGSCPVGACTPKPDPNGTVHSQTWTWDGTTWTEQHPTHAPAFAQLVATPGPDAAPTAFLPGGGIWRWVGSDWNNTEAAGFASTGTGFAVYDAHDANVVVYAIRDTGGLQYSTWTWDGTTWRDRTPALAPVASTTTTAPGETTTTADAAAADPLPTDAAMLQVSGRTISAIDAQGNVVKTLVTAFAGLTVTNAHLMADHRTMFYAEEADDHLSCPAILKLDLQTNVRTLVAHADDFAITPDGSKLFLLRPKTSRWVQDDCRPLPYPPGVKLIDGDFLVRDVATGAQSILPEGGYPSAGTGGPTGHVWMSPTGEELIASTCVIDGCGPIAFTVPKDLGGAIVAAPASAAPTCGCRTLVSGPDGVYGVDEGSGVGTARRTRLLRYDPSNVTGAGTLVVAPTHVTLSSWVAPTSAGLFVIGFPAGSTVANLFRVDNAALHLAGPITSSTDVTGIYPIPPYVTP